jgi:lipoic acid synthetase
MRSFFGDELAHITKSLGFKRVASGPLVRSSYHADKQVKGEALPSA